MRLNLGPSLVEVKTKALIEIDRQAEAARQRYVTPGAGQALEYTATENEARRWLAATDPQMADYPFLKAELDAITSATGVTPDAAAMVAEVIGQADAWIMVGSEIKRIRRQAKMAVEAAATVADVRATMSVLVWP